MSDSKQMDAAVMARLRAPFGCEFIRGRNVGPSADRWRIHDANDDAIASVAGTEEGYARLIVFALNAHFASRPRPTLAERLPVDIAALTRAHVALCAVEEELRAEGRTQAAEGLSIADVVVLNLRHWLEQER